MPEKTLWRSPNGSLYLASLFFALMGVCIKLLTGSDSSTNGLGWRLAGSHNMDAVPIAFYRSLFPALALLPWLWHDLFKNETRRHLPVLILRGLAGGGAMVAYFVAIDRTELSTAVLLNRMNFRLGDRRDVRIETDKDITSGKNMIVGTARWGFMALEQNAGTPNAMPAVVAIINID